MQNKQEKEKRNLADMQAWAADEMKNYAEKTQDPQLKKKYEQICAINRLFYEQLKTDQNDEKPKSRIELETDMLLRAYFCQNALYTAFSSLLTEYERPPKIDEMCDRQVTLCRELLDEAKSRINVIN
ncbi:MAG: hypothetical protein E7539_02975 [Ruminococcaceae bacterium]|nr:hypothetical protein [Oscillospiraceae bacterium]